MEIVRSLITKSMVLIAVILSLSVITLPLSTTVEAAGVKWTPESRQKSTEFKLHIRLH